MSNTTRTVDLGNNEAATIGVVETPEGFLAITFSASKTFKTRAGAVRWLAARGFDANGNTLSGR